MVRLIFEGEVWFWRGPAPFHFVRVDDEGARRLHEVAGLVSYGWRCIAVHARLGGTRWDTSLFPKDGSFAVPIKAAVRDAEGVELGNMVRVELEVPGVLR